jgi:Spy/CpxP family protein refolding chaperone
MKIFVAVRMGVALVSLLAASSLGFAQAPMGGPGFGEHRAPFERALGPMGKAGHWWNQPQLIEKLKLTDEQRKAMDQIFLDHRLKLIDLRGAVEKAELELQPLMQEDQPNEVKALAQIDKLAQARAELEKANARFLFALRAKLTAEQWKTLQTIREDRKDFRQIPPGLPCLPVPGVQEPTPGGPGLDGPEGPGPQSHLDQDSGIGGPDGVEAGFSPEMPTLTVFAPMASK